MKTTIRSVLLQDEEKKKKSVYVPYVFIFIILKFSKWLSC